MREPTIFPAIAINGGTAGALDSFSLADLQDGDGAFVIAGDYSYTYSFDSLSTDAESVPNIIAPDDAGLNPGRWWMSKLYGARDSDQLQGNDANAFAGSVHGSEHVGGTDAIAVASATVNGLMTSETFKRVWAPGDFRNLIINGNFSVWQRGSGVSSGTGYQSADRWLISASANVPVLQSSPIVAGAIQSRSRYSLRVNTTADAVSGAYQIVSHRIENVRTCQNRRVTLSFYTYCTEAKNVAITLRQYFGTGGTPSANVDILPITGESQLLAMDANWKLNVLHFDVPSIVEKTLGTNEDSSLQVLFWFSAGSSFLDLTGALGHQTLQAYLANVQLEEGYIESPVFEDRPNSIEEVLCQRYYWRMGSCQLNFGAYADNCRMSWRFGPGTPMRAVPTAASSFTNVTYTACDSLTFTATGTDRTSGGLLYLLSTGINLNCSIVFGTNDYIALSAEL